MAFTHGRLSYLALDKPDGSLAALSSALNKFDYAKTTDRPETQALGQYAKRYEVRGLSSVQIGVEGFFMETTTKRHGRSATILHGAYDISAYFDTVSLKLGVDLPETQTFGDSWKEHGIPGLKNDSASFTGFHDKTATVASYDILRAACSSDAGDVQTIGPNGFAVGSYVELHQAICSNHSIPMEEEAVTKTSAEFMSDNGMDLGVSLHAVTAEVTTVNSPSVDETAATANGGWAHLHVTTLAGTPGTITFKLQHSTDDITYADLATFSAVTAIGAQRVEIATGTTVNRYVRIAITTMTTFTSVTFQASFARRDYASANTAGGYRHWRALMQRTLSSTFEAGPNGNTAGFPKLTGECRLQDLTLTLSENDVTKFSGTLISDGAVTETTF
jgi:hypothetical protein